MVNTAAINTLLNYGIHPSIQRIAIMDYLLKHHIHPTVDEVYTALSDEIPTLSKTTVYNTLRLFSEHGAAKMLTIDERKSTNSMTNSVIQNLILENREKLSISGALDVLSFDDQIVILETELGLLTVKGENLRINKLSLDTGEVIVDGEIYNLGYSEKDIEKKSGGGILSKIFR